MRGGPISFYVAELGVAQFSERIAVSLFFKRVSSDRTYMRDLIYDEIWRAVGRHGNASRPLNALN
jgi:hypothetical protein